MLLFYGKPASECGKDENASRAARLKVLRAKFFAYKKWSEFAPQEGDKHTHPVQMALNQHQKLSNLVGDRTILVLNAHGSPKTFNGFSGQQVAQQLIELGIGSDTTEIWVASCNVGEQEQDNSQSPILFVKELFQHLREKCPQIKVYGPRGLLTYRGKTERDVGSGQQVIEYSDMCIKTQERDYSFEEGWVLATLP